MFNSAVLDILIGLMTIFLIVALAVTALSELVSQWFSMRSANLKRALVAMLDGQQSSGSNIDQHWFLNQPLIKAMAGGRDQTPSYLDKQTFSAALLLAIDQDYMSKDMGQIAAAIGAQTKIPQQTRELLLAFIKESSDLAHFRANLEGWFDRVMDRASGWYKRRIANVVLVLSALVVAGANIDSIAICQALYGDPQLRAAMLAQAAQSLKEGAPSAPPQDADVRLGQYQADLEKLRSGGLPLGWQSVTRPKGDNLAWYASKVAGLLITILAASLGAPFWFDMLSKVANIRGAGPKPG